MRILILIGMVIAGALIAGFYGALYDQLTYTISPEFFTKYRFIQSQFNEESAMNPRMGVAIIGFLNTWQAGLIIGGILSLAGLITSNHQKMFAFTIHAFIIALAVAFIAGMIGWGVGELPDQEPPDISLNIVDRISFNTVENMNNFSYAGGVIGMFVGIFYQVYKHKKFRERQQGIV